MQKKLIALAVAGLVSAPAFAQSNVTVYGIADLFWQQTNGDGMQVRGVDAGGLSGSRLGFRGTEDLGNGLKAVFDFQFGTLSLDASGGVNATRTSYVGLQGGFGTIMLGRLQTPGFYTSAEFDSTGAAFFSPIQRLHVGLNSGISAENTTLSRVNNAVGFNSQVYGGFSASAVYGYGEEAEGSRGGTTSIGVKYANGPLAVGYVFDRRDPSTSNDQVEHFVGASYDFKVVKLIASWQNQKNEVIGASDLKHKMWQVGVAVPVGAAGSVVAQYAKASVDAASGVDADGSGYGIGYFHSLSKRTTAYAGYGRMTNDDDTNDFGFRKVTPVDGDEQVSTFGVGIRHAF